MPHNVKFSADDRATRKRFVLIPFLILLALAAWGWMSLRQLAELRLTTTRSGNDVRVSPNSDQPFMVTHLAVMGAVSERDKRVAALPAPVACVDSEGIVLRDVDKLVWRDISGTVVQAPGASVPLTVLWVPLREASP